ncbi:MAG: DUF2933 domain-containing protein [Telluria sp.]
MDHSYEHDDGRRRARSRWALYGFLAVAAYFLFAEHRAHLMGVLPYLLVLACPLMHLFHHGHHHHHRDDKGSPP